MSDDEGYGYSGEENKFLGTDVKNFVLDLAKALLDTRDEFEISQLYDIDYNNITEKLYRTSPWPSADTVAPLVREDENFLFLYKELYFRHIYARLKPSVDDRFDSFQNYISLFNIILGLTTEQPELLLPANWLWDIVDEFIYQFRSFHQYRTRVKSLDEEDMELLRDHQHVWSPQTVIRYLHALVNKAGIDITSTREERKEQPDDGSISPLFRTLGEFSLIGLSRVLCLLSDYPGALEALSPIKLSDPQAPFTLVCPARACMAYYRSFAYLMNRRYEDSITTATDFLVWISRNRHTIPRSYQGDLIDKKCEQLLGVLAMAVSICPTKLDGSLESQLQDKFASGQEDKLAKMAHGDEYTFEEIFDQSSPKFISTCPPDYDDPNSNAHELPAQLQRDILVRELKQRQRLPELHSYLKMCTSMSTKKLANFLRVEEDQLSTLLLNAKHKTRNRVNNAEDLEGQFQPSGPVHFFVSKDMVHVQEKKPPQRHGEYFIGQISQMSDLIYTMKNTSFPRPPLK